MELNKYERARILGSRALQISMGAPLLVKVSKKQLEELNYNPIELAKIELEKGVMPITIKRPKPETKAPAKAEPEEPAEAS